MAREVVRSMEKSIMGRKMISGVNAAGLSAVEGFERSKVSCWRMGCPYYYIYEAKSAITHKISACDKQALFSLYQDTKKQDDCLTLSFLAKAVFVPVLA